MKFSFSILAFLACLGAFSAQAEQWGEPDTNNIIWRTSPVENGILWTTPVIEPKAAASPVPKKPPNLGRPFGIIAADEGGYHYEALAPNAEKMLEPTPLEPSQRRGRRPMIAIVIDDMGVDQKHSAEALTLPPMVTMAYLPYSRDLAKQTAMAREKGHELVLHLPMQPERKTANPGPDYLGAGMTPLDLHTRISKNLGSFEGYVAVNNHMGSRFTQSRDGLGVLMSALKEKNLMFLDSRTTPDSLAEKVAREHGLLTTHRDVFIDDDESAAAVWHSLSQIEGVAKRSGTAIAIGHPKDVTLAALQKWLPTLKDKGYDLVPLSQIIALRNIPKEQLPKTASANSSTTTQ